MSEYEEWLKSLQVGDEVAVDIGNYSRHYEIRKIERITPTRRMSLVGKSAEFDANGRERGKKSAWDRRQRIEPVTQEIRDGIRKRYVLARLENAKWENRELAVLEKVLAIIDSTELPSEAGAVSGGKTP